ncbi:hypothetical protein JM83_3466 [Gillisia sp. Hel_I_86]|nr:hypothetical protein JM83_3466 [Gillisia sp. Hel_I_86]
MYTFIISFLEKMIYKNLSNSISTIIPGTSGNTAIYMFSITPMGYYI